MMPILVNDAMIQRFSKRKRLVVNHFISLLLLTLTAPQCSHSRAVLREHKFQETPDSNYRSLSDGSYRSLSSGQTSDDGAGVFLNGPQEWISSAFHKQYFVVPMQEYESNRFKRDETSILEVQSSSAPRKEDSLLPQEGRSLKLFPVFPLLDATLGMLSYAAFAVYIIMLFTDVLRRESPVKSAVSVLRRQGLPAPDAEDSEDDVLPNQSSLLHLLPPAHSDTVHAQSPSKHNHLQSLIYRNSLQQLKQMLDRLKSPTDPPRLVPQTNKDSNSLTSYNPSEYYQPSRLGFSSGIINGTKYGFIPAVPPSYPNGLGFLNSPGNNNHYSANKVDAKGLVYLNGTGIKNHYTANVGYTNLSKIPQVDANNLGYLNGTGNNKYYAGNVGYTTLPKTPKVDTNSLGYLNSTGNNNYHTANVGYTTLPKFPKVDVSSLGYLNGTVNNKHYATNAGYTNLPKVPKVDGNNLGYASGKINITQYGFNDRYNHTFRVPGTNIWPPPSVSFKSSQSLPYIPASNSSLHTGNKWSSTHGSEHLGQNSNIFFSSQISRNRNIPSTEYPNYETSRGYRTGLESPNHQNSKEENSHLSLYSLKRYQEVHTNQSNMHKKTPTQDPHFSHHLTSQRYYTTPMMTSSYTTDSPKFNVLAASLDSYEQNTPTETASTNYPSISDVSFVTLKNSYPITATTQKQRKQTHTPNTEEFFSQTITSGNFKPSSTHTPSQMEFIPIKTLSNGDFQSKLTFLPLSPLKYNEDRQQTSRNRNISTSAINTFDQDLKEPGISLGYYSTNSTMMNKHMMLTSQQFSGNRSTLLPLSHRPLPIRLKHSSHATASNSTSATTETNGYIESLYDRISSRNKSHTHRNSTNNENQGYHDEASTTELEPSYIMTILTSKNRTRKNNDREKENALFISNLRKIEDSHDFDIHNEDSHFPVIIGTPILTKTVFPPGTVYSHQKQNRIYPFESEKTKINSSEALDSSVYINRSEALDSSVHISHVTEGGIRNPVFIENGTTLPEVNNTVNRRGNVPLTVTMTDTIHYSNTGYDLPVFPKTGDGSL